MKQLLPHIEFDRLVRLAEGNLSEVELQKTDKHLAACAECQSSLQKIQDFLAFAEIKTSKIVPQAATANLLNIYQPSKQTKKESFVKRLRGVLAFDDWLPEFAVHERLSFSDTRQMLFRADVFEIDLRLNFANGKCQISGQIFPDCAGGKVEISSEDFTEKVSLNEYCEFVFPFIKEGIYNFLISSDDKKIEIPQISLVN